MAAGVSYSVMDHTTPVRFRPRPEGALSAVPATAAAVQALALRVLPVVDIRPTTNITPVNVS